ncbi:alpha-1,3-mannosyl-glycoprotein 4-beta-N-acetylglucosaminyltransferase C-like [Babylonia areolata]|uniref:alpha-1,3-mannosyl-glycoprotein 4-beta-N-acetylglucosaminyltransferase C-like n=1 Tax=Babylonia areolata TaxID=304850 RepID=UPI003FD014CE
MVTIKREKADYFFTTLASLLQHSSPDEQRAMTVVVMVADRVQERNEEVLKQIKEQYPTQLSTGLLLVIRGPETDFIFQNNDLKRTYQDSLTRVQWRSKQNVDYAALMEYSAPLSTYYLHIEDDVTTADGYLRHIRNFIHKHETTTWAMLELCPHGFIGKLFRSADLPKMVMILRTFYLEQPCDFLMRYFTQMMTQPKPILIPKALFFHQGKYSSLFNVTRKTDKIPLDKGGGGGGKTRQTQVAKTFRKGANPLAEVDSDLSVYQNHGVYNAYTLETQEFLWALDIKKGQRYTVAFNVDQRVKELLIETGFSAQNAKDILQSGHVEMGTVPPSSSSPLLCPGAQPVGAFQKGHFDVTLKPPRDVRCFSVVITADQYEWLIIREIVVVTTE